MTQNSLLSRSCGPRLAGRKPLVDSGCERRLALLVRPPNVADCTETCHLAPMIFAFRPAHFRTVSSVVIAVAVLAAAGCQSRRSATSQSGDRLDFNQDVQPILASNCFS